MQKVHPKEHKYNQHITPALLLLPLLPSIHVSSLQKEMMDIRQAMPLLKSPDCNVILRPLGLFNAGRMSVSSDPNAMPTHRRRPSRGQETETVSNRKREKLGSCCTRYNATVEMAFGVRTKTVLGSYRVLPYASVTPIMIWPGQWTFYISITWPTFPLRGHE